MTKWWNCPECGVITDEFESNPIEKCPDCKKKENNEKEIECERDSCTYIKI